MCFLLLCLRFLLGNIDYPWVWNIGGCRDVFHLWQKLDLGSVIVCCFRWRIWWLFVHVKKKGRSGGFFGDWTLLSSNPSSQAGFRLGYLLVTLGEEGEEFCSFVVWDVVFCHVADCSCAIVVTVSFQMRPRAHPNFARPRRSIMW
jgi:hypothetical protein